MDAFLGTRDKNLRARLRRRLGEYRSAGGSEGEFPERLLDSVWEGAARPTVLERGLVLEELFAFSPRLGREMSRLIDAAGEEDPASASGSAAAESIGSSAFVLDACTRAALEKNLFVSVLMRAGKIQQDLADFTAALESVRFETYRSFLLLDRGEKGQGAAELARAAERACGLRAGILSLASDLLGKDWLRVNVPGDPPERAPGARPDPARAVPGEPIDPNERSEP
jgi:hypothetical protein